MKRARTSSKAISAKPGKAQVEAGKTHYRTVWISDVHLGTPGCKAEHLVEFLKSLGIEKSALLALSPDADKSKNARLSARNIEGVSMCRADQLNAFEMLNSRHVVIDKSDLEAWLAGPSSQTGKDAKVEPKGAGEKKPRRVRPYTKKQAQAAGEGGA